MTTERFIKSVQDAILLAMKFHNDQMYGKYSYIHHCENVAHHTKEIHRKGLFDSLNLDKKTLITIAYLHDIQEDTDIPEEEILKFNPDVVAALKLLTKSKGRDYVYKDYIANIKQSPYARVVKIADTWSNLESSFKNGDSHRITKYTAQLAVLLAP